ncbi:MAG: LysM domain/M23/M37 peptidase domain protein [Treponematales bacterium]
MSELLLNQHIRRRGSRLLAELPGRNKKPAFRPEGFITDTSANRGFFIESIQQKPARRAFRAGGVVRRQSEMRMGRSVEMSGYYRKPAGDYDGRYEEAWDEVSEKRGRNKSIAVLPLLGFSLLLIASVAALTWEAGNAPSWFPREVISSVVPPADTGGQFNMAAYAGVASTQTQGAEVSTQEGEDIPLDLFETFAWGSYRVKEGDSVSKIAANHALSIDAIIASNGISNARRLRVGEVLRIPNMDGIPYTVRKGDTLEKISSSSGVPLNAILDANDIQSEALTQGTQIFLPGAKMRSDELKLALGELFNYPVRNFRLTSLFGWRKDPFSGLRSNHAGIDMAASMGARVNSAMDGTVSATGFNRTFGNFVIVKHAGGYQTLYGHLSAISVKKGDNVSSGAKIGEVGNTGMSTGPHLHFAVYKNNRAIDPREVLPR